MPDLDEGLSLILSISLSILATLIIAMLHFKKAPIGERPSNKNLIRTFFLTFLATAIINTCIYWFVADLKTGIFLGIGMPFFILPLNILLIGLLYINRSYFMTAWLALSLLTPNIYNAALYLKAHGFSKFLESSWSKIPAWFDIFGHFFAGMFLIRIPNSGELDASNPLLLTLKGLLIHFAFWAIIVFGLQAILKRMKKE